jgi:hypothetical protein
VVRATEGATALAGGDYGDALVDYTYGLNALVGAAVSF